MTFTLFFTAEAEQNLVDLGKNRSLAKRLKAVRKSLGYLQINPRHPSLATHKYHSFQGPNGEELFEAYAENDTPAAYRLFWYYGPNKNSITVVAITPHP